ncbi:MAG: hypothetical protein DWQ37_14705 [Planctomycetota bacterium]|nr:MAG: hypothetical protein DWQ37_14705 [Planctomycetota bacterium]
MSIEPEFFSLRRRSQVRARRPLLEPLESRIALSAVAPDVDQLTSDSASHHHPVTGIEYPGGVTVTDTEIHTHSDVFPRFAAEPTITNVRSGSWSDPTVWSEGRLPWTGDRVVIAKNTVVLYSIQRAARLDALEINGSLVISRVSSTRMYVGDVTVMPTGRLQIGAPGHEVSPSVKAELIIADKPHDFEADPQQFGTGLLAFGKVAIYGTPVASTWQRLVREPVAGATYLELEKFPTSWKPGDTLVLPDTRQVPSTDIERFRNNEIPGEWERVVIEAIIGKRVYLKSPLQFDHLGARNPDGELELLPHVALLDRNVIIRSENSEGTRGHTLFAARAKVDINHVHFLDLGRTDALKRIDNTHLDEYGNVVHIGKNQIARYAVHFHHLMGPEDNTDLGGQQYRFVGNTVENSKKWAVAVHGTNFGLVDSNVVYHAQGAGIVTEDGSEIGNMISNNITIRMQGTHQDGKDGTWYGDYGRGGSGFWFRRGGNAVINNVAADSTYAGFVFDGYFTDQVRLPAFPGAMKHMPDQGITTRVNPTAVFANNEAYGMSRLGLWAAFVSGDHSAPNQPGTYIHNLHVWHTYHAGVHVYHTANLTFGQLLVLGDLEAQNRNHTGTRGLDLATYENLNLRVVNSRIEGVRFAVYAPTNDASLPGIERPTVIQNTTLKSYINVTISPSRESRPSNGSVLELRNVKFEVLPDLPAGPVDEDLLPKAANIRMLVSGEFLAWTEPTIVRVFDYNQVRGDNFEVYFNEQSADFVMPSTHPSLLGTRNEGDIGSPEEGLTNAANWAKYKLSMGGSVAPPEAYQRPGITGLVSPIRDLTSVSPRVVMTTPWNGAVVHGNVPVRLRYNVLGLLPKGAKVFFQVDLGEPFSEFSDGGMYNIPAGVHNLRAYIGDEDGKWIPGTLMTNIMFTVVL